MGRHVAAQTLELLINGLMLHLTARRNASVEGDTRWGRDRHRASPVWGMSRRPPQEERVRLIAPLLPVRHRDLGLPDRRGACASHARSRDE
jgi:hypothetical protein